MNPPYRLFLLATAALAAPAPAQATPADVVVTAAGAPQSVNETGDAITVVTRDALEAPQTVSIADYLAPTPALPLPRSGGPGALTTPSLLGAEAPPPIVLIDR